MSVVFADAFCFVARLNRRDQHHEHVLKFSRNFRARLLTTDWVLVRVADALARFESGEHSSPKIKETCAQMTQARTAASLSGRLDRKMNSCSLSGIAPIE